MATDPMTIIYEWLLEPGTDLASVVGNRIWGPVAAPGYRNEDPALVFHPETQTPEAPQNVLTTLFTFKIYGGSSSFSDARSVAMKLYDRLHMVRGTTASGQIVRSRCVFMTQGVEDPDTGWPYHVAKYEVITD